LEAGALHLEQGVEVLLDVLRKVVLRPPWQHIQHYLDWARRSLFDSDVQRSQSTVVRVNNTEVEALSLSDPVIIKDYLYDMVVKLEELVVSW